MQLISRNILLVTDLDLKLYIGKIGKNNYVL
jgi:hypothetical protein